MSDADILRKAAGKAYRLADATRCDDVRCESARLPWRHGQESINVSGDGSVHHPLLTVDIGPHDSEIAAYVAAWHPGVALAVAEIWDAAADSLVPHRLIVHAARLFLGED